MSFDLDRSIRKIPDFPKPGILFYDITGILNSPPALAYVIDRFETMAQGKSLQAVAGVESRGFIFAAPLALRLGLPLLLVRKKGKLPGRVLQKTYDLEYGQSTIEVHADDVPAGGNILLIDDLLATGGTLQASCELLEGAGAKVTEIFCVVGLPFLHPEKKLTGRTYRTLIDYQSEHL